MAEHDVPLLVHGESIDPDHDVFDREANFIRDTLAPLVQRFDRLRVVLEHITTADAVDFVRSAPPRVAATITAHHLLYNRGAIFAGGLRPHMYCLPVLKRERHRQALVQAATSGDPKFFLGTDSAPHVREAKESACGCAGIFTAHAALELYAEAFDAAMPSTSSKGSRRTSAPTSTGCPGPPTGSPWRRRRRRCRSTYPSARARSCPYAPGIPSPGQCARLKADGVPPQAGRSTRRRSGIAISSGNTRERKYRTRVTSPALRSSWADTASRRRSSPRGRCTTRSKTPTPPSTTSAPCSACAWPSSSTTSRSRTSPLPWEERKRLYLEHFVVKPWEAQAITLADKIDNLQSIVVCKQHHGDPWPQFKRGRDAQLKRYDKLAAAARNLPGHPLIDEFAHVLDAVRRV